MLQDKKILVTGATSGIGYAAAHDLLDAGANIIAIGRNGERLAELAAHSSGRIQAIAFDLTRFVDYHETFAGVPALDGVVCSAGIADSNPLRFFSLDGATPLGSTPGEWDQGTGEVCVPFYVDIENSIPGLIAVLVLAVVVAPVMIFSPQGLPRLRSLGKELSEVEGENDELRREIQRLHGEVEHLRHDPAAVERIARDELGLVRKSEVVFQFPRAR